MTWLKYFFAALTLPWLLTLVATGLTLRRVPDVSIPARENWLWLDSAHPVGTEFTSQHSGLNVVTIHLKNVALRNNLPLLFNLTDSRGNSLRQITLSGSNIGDGENIRFQFIPLPDSAGRVFRWQLSSPDTPASLAIGVAAADSQPAFDTWYRPQNLAAVLDPMAQQLLLHLTFPPFGLSLVFFLFLWWALSRFARQPLRRI